MADLLLSQMLQCELDHEIITDAIKNGSSIKYKDITVPLSEFIPHFLSYLRERLNISTTSNNTYFSPRQLAEKRKKEKAELKNDETDLKKGVPKKTARLSLQYASSSPMKTIPESNHNASISGISPIKITKSPTKSQQNKKKKIVLTSPVQDNSQSKSNFELNSLEDFPSISFTSALKNPRRIRATTVVTSKSSFNTSASDIPKTSSFLEESSFEAQHCDPSLDKLFLDDKRFLKNISESQSIEGNSSGKTCDELEFSAMTCNSNMCIEGSLKLKTTPTKSISDTIDIVNIREKDILDSIVEVYINLWLNNLIPNFTLELYFLFITLTIPLTANQNQNFSHPFQNIESCVYFAVKSLERLVSVIVLLDERALNLLVSNSRIKHLTSIDFVNNVQDIISNDITSSNVKKPTIIKSPMTGIPFQVESDNRKSFVCDKHFYSFSKKRDAFYALVREWQDNYLDPDWNMKQFMSRKVPDIMKMNIEISTHYQFAKLFVAQLLEMCRNYVGNKTNELTEKSSLLIDLQKRNPTKYQSLQDRLTRPSFSNDPCPKPSFSIVEQFFKEFIDVADGYCFSKILKHVLMSYILEINSNSFGFDLQVTNCLNKSDFAESLWLEIKVAVSELRLLAKFLGYVVFLPYNYSSEYIDDKISKSRHLLAEPLDLSEYLYQSYINRKLLITVPWVVDFFSMADKHAFDHAVYNKTMKYLVCLFQCSYMSVMNTSLLFFSLNLHIGWLFELPHVENINFYEPDAVTKEAFGDGNLNVGIDDIVTVDKEFLYSLCPYLNDIKKPLVDFAKGTNVSMPGSFRKITPVRTSDIFSIDLKSNLKVQLIDSLMRYVSNQVKDVMKYISEKHFMNIKHHISEVIIPACCQNVLEKTKEQFRIGDDVSVLNLEDLKMNNNIMYQEHIEHGKEEVASNSHEYLEVYLRDKVCISMETLLPESTHKKILDVSSRVVKHNVRLKLQEWMIANRSLYLNEANVLYSRYVMNIVKTNKDVKLHD